MINSSDNQAGLTRDLGRNGRPAASTSSKLSKMSVAALELPEADALLGRVEWSDAAVPTGGTLGKSDPGSVS